MNIITLSVQHRSLHHLPFSDNITPITVKLTSSESYVPFRCPYIPSDFKRSRTIRDAVKYVHSSQKPEGGWFGSWGICFTYATMFALESLSLVGETYENSQSVRRACDYLVSKQREDGGWGESYKVSILA